MGSAKPYKNRKDTRDRQTALSAGVSKQCNFSDEAAPDHIIDHTLRGVETAFLSNIEMRSGVWSASRGPRTAAKRRDRK
jgi:hypothetical protein